MRRWSNFWPDWQWDLSVRRDRGPFSYGFELTDNQRWTTYRTDGFDTNFNGGAYRDRVRRISAAAAHIDHARSSTMRSTPPAI